MHNATYELTSTLVATRAWPNSAEKLRSRGYERPQTHADRARVRDGLAGVRQNNDPTPGRAVRLIFIRRALAVLRDRDTVPALELDPRHSASTKDGVNGV